MSAVFQLIAVHAAAPSANTTLTATRCNVANCATADAVAMATDSVPWKSVNLSACSAPRSLLLAM